MAAVKVKKPTSKLKAGKKKPLNKWIIVGGVAAVALVGALVVRFSGASSYAFVRYASNMRYGEYGNTPGRFNHDSVTYATVSTSGLWTIASDPELKASKTVCTHVVNLTSKDQYVSISSGSNGNNPLQRVNKGKTGNACMSYKVNTNYQYHNIISMTVTPVDSSRSYTGSVGVSTIYGKK